MTLPLLPLAQLPTRLLLLLAVILVIKMLWPVFQARIKGWVGEKSVSHLGLRRLPRGTYKVIDDLYLPRPDGEGTTQLDHVVVSIFGIFVIETKNVRGWVFGSEKQKEWTVTLYKKKHRMQNPLHQNALHVRALSEYLGIEREKFHSIVFFIGDSNFKTSLPTNVLDNGLNTYIRSHQEPVLTPPEIQSIVAQLEGRKSGSSRAMAREHVRGIKKRRTLELS